MKRGFWLALPVFLIVALDAFLTLLGQSTSWWLGVGPAREANPVGIWFLGYGSNAFALAMTGWAGLILLLASSLPGILGRTFYGACLLGHAAGVLSWASGYAPFLLRRCSSRMGGSSFLESWASSPHAGVSTGFVLLVAMTGITAFCWDRAGVLAASKKPSAGKESKKEKDK